MAHDHAIKVSSVSKTFKLPHERHTSIKSALINLGRAKKSYEKQRVLDGVSLEIKKGEFFAIVGRNGSGKSTLLKLLAGIYTPDAGNINTNGKLIPFIELGVGFNPELSGRENVYLNGALLGFNRREMDAMYEDIVAFAEIERFMDQKLKNYSSGMQVRLAFSIAIRAKGEILLLDEVLAVGDAAFQQKCYDYFEELKQQKKTVIFVSHDMGAVRRFCTKAVYIKDGKLIREGSPVEIADEYIAENMERGQEAAGASQKLPNTYSIKSKLVKQTDKTVELTFTYTSKDDTQMYVGISLIKDGISIGEITTSLQKPLVGNGVLTYTLDIATLNAGGYSVGAGLFKLHNRELIGIAKSKNAFIIKGSDITKGGALKLAETWKYE